MISIFFPFEPVAKARPRLGKHGTYTPTKTKNFENDLRAYALAKYKGKPLDGPISLSLTFNIKRGKTVKRRFPTTRPDLDNYVKAVADAMNEILWNDDSQVVDLWCCKRYTDDAPGIDLMCFEIRGSEDIAIK